MEVETLSRFGRHFSFAVITLSVALLSLAVPVLAASLHPFVEGGFQRTNWEKTDRNALMDLITFKNASSGWEAATGVVVGQGPAGSGRETSSPLRFQLRVSGGAGKLPGSHILNGRRFNPYTGRSFYYSSWESYSHSWWEISPALVIRVLPEADLYIGPALQTVKFKAKRIWDGPSGFSETGNATDATTIRYGLIDLGARVYPARHPLFLEGSWAPFRARLSTTHKVLSSNWTTAIFSTFTASYSLRVGYEF
jgi:hypothetical protein